jgi:hypothetical protein
MMAARSESLGSRLGSSWVADWVAVEVRSESRPVASGRDDGVERSWVDEAETLGNEGVWTCSVASIRFWWVRGSGRSRTDV